MTAHLGRGDTRAAMKLNGRPVVHRLEVIPPGEAGTRATVQRMEEFTARAAADPVIRTTAVKVLRNHGARQHDAISEVSALHGWVQSSIDYRRDPHGVEFIADPVHTLTMGGGDCDDRSTLLAALLRSVGYRTRFVVSSTAPGLSRPFQHVFPQVFVRNAGWISVDPTRRLSPGEMYPRTTRAAVLEQGRFVDMYRNAPRRFVVPRRMLEDGSAVTSLGLAMDSEGQFVYLGDDFEDDEVALGGWFKKLVKKVKKVQPIKALKKVQPLKLVKKVAKLAPIGLIPGGAAGAALVKQLTMTTKKKAAMLPAAHITAVPPTPAPQDASSIGPAYSGASTIPAASPSGDEDDFAAETTAVPGIAPAAGSPSAAKLLSPARAGMLGGAIPAPVVIAGALVLIVAAGMAHRKAR